MIVVGIVSALLLLVAVTMAYHIGWHRGFEAGCDIYIKDYRE